MRYDNRQYDNSTFALQPPPVTRRPPAHGGGADGAVDAGAAAAAPRLEYTSNNPTKQIDYRMVFVACRCKSRMCIVCGPRMGFALRMRLLAEAAPNL